MQPPSTLAQMTKKRSVSIGRPGPTMVSHQPGLPVTGWAFATCWSPVSAWQTSTALERVGVERAVGLVGDLPGRERDAGIEQQRLVRAEARDRARRLVGLAQRLGRDGGCSIAPSDLFGLNGYNGR